MKKIVLAIAGLLFIGTTQSQSLEDQIKQYQQKQDNQNYQLTEVEYRYITKGLFDDVSMGKDIKQGYELKPIVNAPFATQETLFGSSFMQVFGFYKIGITKPIALAIKFVKQGKQQNFLCVPKFGSNAALTQNCKTDFGKLFDNPNSLSVSLCFNSLQYIATYQ